MRNLQSGRVRLTVGSVNTVFRANQILAGVGIRSSAVRSEGTGSGCAYGVSVARENLRPALTALARHGINVSAVTEERF